MAWFAVAWAKRSGLRLIQSDLQSFKTAGGRLRMLIGVDQHGGTIEGLELARVLSTEARVYHDANTRPPRTFHPKLYVVEGLHRARAIVGSGNLTAGGFRTNYELALGVDLNLKDQADEEILAQLRTWFDARWAQPEATHRLTKRSIERLIADPDVTVLPETYGPPRSPGARGAKTKNQTSLFGKVRGLAAPERHPNVNPADQIDNTVGNERIEAPFAGDDSLVLVAGLPQDRPGQAGFNRLIANEFFGVSKNEDPIAVQAVLRDGSVRSPEVSKLVNPTRSNGNHRFEMREPEGRPRVPRDFPILLVHRAGPGLFRYLYVFRNDTGFRSVDRERARREPIGRSNKPETKRVYMTLGELRSRWPGCPIVLAARIRTRRGQARASYREEDTPASEARPHPEG